MRLRFAERLAAGEAPEVPPLAQRIVAGLAHQIGDLQRRLTALEKELLALHRSSELSQRLATIPGIGVISATALAASVVEPERFRSGRQFAASLGLTPLANCSGGKERLGKISRMGDRYLRRLFVVGMTSLVRRARSKPDSVDPRIVAMLERRPARVVTVAAANRTARVVWAIMTKGGHLSVTDDRCRVDQNPGKALRSLRGRSDVMAYRSDREQGHPAECPRHHSLPSRVGPSSRIPSGPAVTTPTASTGRTEDCTRPPARNVKSPLQCGSHPQRTFAHRQESTPKQSSTPNGLLLQVAPSVLGRRDNERRHVERDLATGGRESC
jgi:transposase